MSSFQNVRRRITQWELWGLNRLGFSVGERTSALMGGLRWNALAASISRVLCGAATLLAARWLGPESFGSANLALAAAFWIQIPLFFGIPTALMHYIPQAKAEDRPRWSASGLLLLALCAGGTLAAGSLFSADFARWHGVSSDTFRLALFWCAGFAVYMAATALFSAQERFAERARSEIIFAALFSAGVLLCGFSGILNAAAYVVAFPIAYAASGIWGLGRSWPVPFTVDPPHVRKLLAYGSVAFLGSVVNALFNAPARLITHHYLSLGDVGVLSAYQGGSVQMAYFFIGIGAQVFFPIASRTPDRPALFNKMNRFMALSALPLLAGFAFLLAVYLGLLGRSYPLIPSDLMIFSLAAVLTTFYGLLAWFLSSEGRRGVLFFSVTGLMAGAINILACFILIPRWGLSGAGCAQIIACAAGMLFCHLPGAHKFFRRQGPATHPS